jgi:leucyl aminopeptidase (aminopeptidase T)
LEEFDPTNFWLDYLDLLFNRANHLTEKVYQALTFTGPGTDLKVGLLENYIRKGGKGKFKFLESCQYQDIA